MSEKKPVKQGVSGLRDSKGRFKLGASGNPNGRPKISIAERLRDYLDQPHKGGKDRGEHLIDTLYKQATAAADMTAARLLLSYAYGNPKETIETTEVPLEEKQAGEFITYLDGHPKTANSYRKYLLQQRQLAGGNGD